MPDSLRTSSKTLLQRIVESPLDYELFAAALLFFVAFSGFLAVGNFLVAWLKGKRWQKDKSPDETWAVREDTPETHQAKSGTPSMGGIGIIAATLVACLFGLWSVLLVPMQLKGWKVGAPQYAAMSLLPLVFLAHGALGFADDWSKASGRGGLRARSKLFGQILLALGFVVVAWLMAWQNPRVASPVLFTTVGVLGLLFAVLVIVAVSNAVNLTDGIDGLAAGLAVQCGFFLYFASPPIRENYFLSGLFWSALAGACFGFLLWNRYPARIFMGDTGSLAIGAALAAGAILQGAVFLLPFIGFIYLVEMLSVVLQVFWFQWTKRRTGEGKRLLRRAPLHHHFELGGWSEWRVVGTFWAINLVTSAIGLWLWNAGILPRWP